MKIIFTDIEDITPRNLDEAKINIAQNILNTVGPLFESEIEGTVVKLVKVKEQKKKLDQQLMETKTNLERIQDEFGRENKRKKLLNRIRQIIEVNLTSDPSLRSEIIILLKVIDKLEDNLLDEHIERMIKTISNRFSKTI